MLMPVPSELGLHVSKGWQVWDYLCPYISELFEVSTKSRDQSTAEVTSKVSVLSCPKRIKQHSLVS